MKWINLAAIILFLFATAVKAQDAVLVSEGNFVRGVVQGTNFSSVALLQDDQTVATYQAKDVLSFVWNGDTYVSKPIIVKKKMEFRFFKLIESGTVNLYAYGDKQTTEQTSPSRVRVRPSFGLGVGSGGFGGGLGGGVSIGIGGNRRNEEQGNANSRGKVTYFLEKPGSGPMREVALEGGKSEELKALLLQKLTDDEDLAQRIKATEEFDAKNLAAFIRAYNEMHK